MGTNTALLTDMHQRLNSVHMILLLAIAGNCVLGAPSRVGDMSSEIEKIIAPIAEKMAEKYGCAVSVAVLKDGDNGFKAATAAGVIDGGGKQVAHGTPTTIDDLFVWGSVTKVLTGTGVLRLISEGKMKLTDSIPQHIDPFLKRMKARNPSQNFSSVADLFGPETADVTLEDLLGMKSGIPDFDTASPTGRQPTDWLRETAYAHPNSSFPPETLLNVPWCHTGQLLFTPGVCDKKKYGNCYTSTNFVLLGFVLANEAGVDDWDLFTQQSILADVMKDFNPGLKYAVHGPPSNWTAVRGYDTTSYNHNNGSIEVSKVSGVFSGWTASDLVGTASDVARLAYDVYAPPYKLVAKRYVDMMYETSNLTGYGLATFNLTRRTGQHGPDGVAMGHLGATYGYQSIVAYNPAMGFSLAIATNIETNDQSQPADTMCSVYNSVRAVIRGLPQPNCTYKHGYWDGGCNCTTPSE